MVVVSNRCGIHNLLFSVRLPSHSNTYQGRLHTNDFENVWLSFVSHPSPTSAGQSSLIPRIFSPFPFFCSLNILYTIKYSLRMEDKRPCQCMSTNAENARKNLRCCRRLERTTKDCVVQNAMPINPKNCSLHFVQEAPKVHR